MSFYYESFGKGDIPLVMLHGFGDTLESLKPLALLLSETRQVLLIDLPGFGKSPYDESLISAHDMAKALSDFLKKKGISRVDLLGHSFGGKVGISFSSLYPGFVRNLVLIASSGLKKRRGIKKGVYFSLIRALRESVKLFDHIFCKNLFHSWFIPKFASSDYKNFPTLRKILVRSINENIDQRITELKSPVLLLWGALDEETPLDMGYQLQKMIKGSQIVVYPTLGHRPFKDVGRHLIKEHVERFLEGSPC